MKILYAIQGTGNGHLSRAREIAPFLMEEGEVDLLVSGKSSEVDFPYPFKYKYHGLFFIFGRKGGINYTASMKKVKPFRLFNDIRQCPVEKYDLIVNDFEPVSAWACRLKRIDRIISVSHQAAFRSGKVPRPVKINRFMEMGMKRFAPAQKYLGIHYRAYDRNISTPVIRREIAGAKVSEDGHITVYLPSYSDDVLIRYFRLFPNVRWEVFSKKTDVHYVAGNVDVHPIDNRKYVRSLAASSGFITGAGFQGTSEGLYLNKKMLILPMYDQYEQLCNAEALKEFGVTIVERIQEGFEVQLGEWLVFGKPPDYRFSTDTRAFVMDLLRIAQE